MAYIISLIGLALLFFALKEFTELTKAHRISITAILFFIIYAAIAYNTHSNNERAKLLSVVTKFNQNRTIKCNGIDVNNSEYTLSIGTYTFIGKEHTQNYGVMISASNCN